MAGTARPIGRMGRKSFRSGKRAGGGNHSRKRRGTPAPDFTGWLPPSCRESPHRKVADSFDFLRFGRENADDAVSGRNRRCHCRKLLHSSTIGRGTAENHDPFEQRFLSRDRKSTRLNSSHVAISYAVFCLKKKNN